MLRHLSIRDFAIIDTLELDFAGGFTVLSGETGAGKSILIDALGLLLGDRADGAMVRGGRERAELTAEFALDESLPLRQWLREQALDDPDVPGQCVLRRVIQADGRTRVFINGSASTVSVLRELGEQLVEIHGQHEHQRLSRGDEQRALLDESSTLQPLAQDVRAAAQQHAQLQHAIERARSAAGRDPAQLEFLRFQLKELEALNLAPGELEQIELDHRQLANAGRLQQDGGRAEELLYGGDQSLHDQLATVTSQLAGLAALHPGFAEAEGLLGTAQAQLRDAAAVIRRLLDRMDLDPERLAEVEKRMGAVHELARKHRVKPEALAERTAALQAELVELERAATDVDRLQAEQAQALARYSEAARKLSAARAKAAQSLSKKVTDIVRELGMSQAKFTIAVESAGRDAPRLHGDDDVRFDFSANPGQPPRALAKVASGGELSRVALAVQVAATQAAGPATMIFDEVDAGIGGGVAEIVGQKLRALGAARQVLCVTHLPQVAAQGAQHFSVRKEVKSGQTYTRVQPLDAAERPEELARMLGGVEITAQTRAHAKEMLARARKSA